VGLSPKAPAAAVAALLGPLVARLLADLLNIEVDSETAEGLILAAIAAFSALGGAYLARPGAVATTTGTPARVADERGQAGVGVVVFVVAIIVIVLLLKAFTGSWLVLLLLLLLLLVFAF